jgi:glycosyltransferase involved in cell wall biosynthesis
VSEAAAAGGRTVAVVATPETHERAARIAKGLVASGEEVTFVAPGALTGGAPSGTAVIFVDEPQVEVTPPYLHWSYAFYAALAGRDLAAIVFPSVGGHAYCAARARQVGSAFPSTAVIIDCEEVTIRAVERERRPFLSRRVLGVGVTERIALELADALICEDAELLGWLTGRGWAIPDRRLGVPGGKGTWTVRADERSCTLTGEPPLVSIVIAVHERTTYLPLCLEALARQSHRALEVLVVDDGSRSASAAEGLATLEGRSWPWPLRVVHVPHGGLGAARNCGWRAANAELVLFIDDDDVAFDELVATLVRARSVSGADVAVAGARFFRGDAAPTPHRGDVVRISLCEPRELGLISNQYGGPVNLWPRDLLNRLGGFNSMPTEDWDLLARATYAGARLTTPPDPLYWYRQTAGSMYSADPFAFRAAGLVARVEPVAELLPEEWRLLPHLAAGAYGELEGRQRAARPRWRAAVDRGRLLAKRAVEVRDDEGISGVGRSAVRFARRRYDRHP